MKQYHECGAALWVEYREDGGTVVRVYSHDDKPVTECPNCGAPLPAEVPQPKPDHARFVGDTAEAGGRRRARIASEPGGACGPPIRHASPL